MSKLEEKLDALIAKEDHIRPDEVTLEHIRKMRDVRDKSGNLIYDFSTRYGGFNRKAAKVLTPSQSLEVVEKAYRFLSGFARKRQR